MVTWPEFFIMFMALLTILGGLGIGAFLVVNGHPWFALLVFFMAGSVNVKTGCAAECHAKTPAGEPNAQIDQT